MHCIRYSELCGFHVRGSDTEDSEWRNRSEFLKGREEIKVGATARYEILIYNRSTI